MKCIAQNTAQLIVQALQLHDQGVSLGSSLCSRWHGTCIITVSEVCWAMRFQSVHALSTC